MHPWVMLQSMRPCSTMPRSAQCECRRRPFLSLLTVCSLHPLSMAEMSVASYFIADEWQLMLLCKMWVGSQVRWQAAR